MSSETKDRIRSPNQPDLRPAVTVLLLGGLLLVVMTQSVFAQVYPQHRKWAIWLIAAGLISFALGGHLIARRHLPRRINTLIRRLTTAFGISMPQLPVLLFAPCFALLAGLTAGDDLTAINWPISLTAWLLSIGALIAGSYRSGDGMEKTFDRRDVVIVISLFLLAFSLRVLAIDKLPPTLSGDEGSAGLMAVNFLNGRANNLLSVGWFSFPSLYFAVQSLGIWILSQTAAGLRISSVFAGALTVVALYWLVRSLFGRTAAVLAAIFLAVFHFHIHFSRIGLNNIWDGFFSVMVLAGLWNGWKTGRRSSFIICGLALGLGQYFYVTLRVFPFLLLMWSGVTLIWQRPAFKRRLPDLVLAAYIAFVVALPIIFFFARHPNEFNAPLQRVTIFDGWLDQMVLVQGKPALAIIGDQVVNSILGITHVPLRHWYNPGSPLLLASAAGLFLLGLLWALTHMSSRYWLILLPILAVIVLGSLSQDAPASQRYIIAAPMVAILVATPLAVMAGWLRRLWPQRERLVLVIVALAITWVSARELHYYFFEVYENYVLGGLNTQVATAVAAYLDEQEPLPDVYFFGFPRMGYGSLSTIPYLVPDVEAVDVLEPLAKPPEWLLDRPTVFLFLPERKDELAYVRAAYPNGLYWEELLEDGHLLFIAYEVAGP